MSLIKIDTVKQQKAKQEQDIAEAKQYLAESDWIVTKIAEAQIEGLDTTALKAKYIDELSHRKLMRDVINGLEAQQSLTERTLLLSYANVQGST